MEKNPVDSGQRIHEQYLGVDNRKPFIKAFQESYDKILLDMHKE